MILKELAPGIVSVKNVIDNPDQLIKDIEDSVSLKVLEWSEAHQSDTDQGGGYVAKDIRNCSVISLPGFERPEMIGSFNEGDVKYLIHKQLGEYLLPALDMYKNSYSCNAWSVLEGWQIIKYEKDNFFINHYDDNKHYPRTISMSFYINDNYSGGEIEFPRFNLKIKPEKNEMIIFPSNYVYNHIIHPVNDGVRYVVVGWWE